MPMGRGIYGDDAYDGVSDDQMENFSVFVFRRPQILLTPERCV